MGFRCHVLIVLYCNCDYQEIVKYLIFLRLLGIDCSLGTRSTLQFAASAGSEVYPASEV